MLDPITHNLPPYDKVKHYPKQYFCRAGKSDRGWIFKMLVHIPEDKQKEVSERYLDLYKLGRKEANTYLHQAAKGFCDAKKNI